MASSIAVSKPVATRGTSRHLVRLLTAGLVLAASFWLLGLGWFLYMASGGIQTATHFDAIVALTGGPDRVAVAMRLFINGTGDRLLVSGTGEKTDLIVLAHRAGIDPAQLEQHITLGHAAHSTLGNARETAAWAHDQEIGSMLVVTSWFHMPRALLDLRREMPRVTIQPYPVGHLSAAELTKGGTARRVVGEYHKYLAALAGLTVSPFTSANGTEPAG